MYINPEKIGELYKGYQTAQTIWTNINSENINENSELMYDLYRNLNEYPILNSKSTTEEKKEEVQDRFTDLGLFMFDTESIEVLTDRNNKAYSFLTILKNPFLITQKECEKTYIVNTEEPLIETKARTIDCENKIAKMCMAQIANIVEPEAKSKAGSEKEIKKEIITRIQEYTILLDKLQGTRLQENPELQEQAELFTSEGYFDMTKFLETANETNVNAKPIELKNKYGNLIDTVINKDNTGKRRQSISGMEYDINNFGKFAIAKRLMTKLYEYKEVDLYDVFNEYDLLKGTKEENNFLITSNKDAKLENKSIERAIDITIKGYVQSFSIHVRDNLFENLQNKFGEIPSTVVVPVKRRSLVTSKLKKPLSSLVSDVYKQDRGRKTVQYLEYLEDLQNIKECKKKIKSRAKSNKSNKTKKADIMQKIGKANYMEEQLQDLTKEKVGLEKQLKSRQSENEKTKDD